jgi:nucleoside permease NupC
MIPGEIISLLSSFLVGIVSRYMAEKSKQREFELEIMGRKADLELQSFQAARESKIDGGKAVRRMLATLAAVYLFILPFVAVLAGINVWYAYPENTAKVLFWGGREKMTFQELPGFVVLPIHVHTGLSIIGFYFGSSRRSR